MRISKILDVEKDLYGLGKRTVIFFTGCDINCNGCNKNYKDYHYGVEYTPEDVVQRIKNNKTWIDGITLTGGEPLYQKDLKEFLSLLKSDEELKKLDIWLYTGYDFENVPNWLKLKINVIIDKTYNDKYSPLTWRSSGNQRIWVKEIGHHYKQLNEKEINKMRFQNDI